MESASIRASSSLTTSAASPVDRAIAAWPFVTGLSGWKSLVYPASLVLTTHQASKLEGNRKKAIRQRYGTETDQMQVPQFLALLQIGQPQGQDMHPGQFCRCQ